MGFIFKNIVYKYRAHKYDNTCMLIAIFLTVSVRARARRNTIASHKHMHNSEEYNDE